VGLLEIAVDNLASARTADQQGDGRRAKWVGTLSSEYTDRPSVCAVTHSDDTQRRRIGGSTGAAEFSGQAPRTRPPNRSFRRLRVGFPL